MNDISKVIYLVGGKAYFLKKYDTSGNVIALLPLDPGRLVSPPSHNDEVVINNDPSFPVKKGMYSLRLFNHDPDGHTAYLDEADVMKLDFSEGTND